MSDDVIVRVTCPPGTRQERVRWRCRALAVLSAASVGVLAGCAGGPSADPVDWWHGLEGGKISELRAPPPKVDAPYPRLSTIPPRPTPPDQAKMAAIASKLSADRANAQYEAQAEPIPQLTPTAPRPPAPLAKPANADDEAPSASLEAANSQPQAPGAPAPAAAPAAPTKARPPPPPATPAAAPVASAPAAADAEPVPMPDIPEAPPLPPSFAGVPKVTTSTAPPATPPPKPAPPGAPGAPVPVAFPAASAILQPQSDDTLKALAASRGARSITVTGLGEAPPQAATDAQAAALPLALDRARAVAAALRAHGVPAAAIRLAAQPSGGGAVARLTD